jgi:lipopolysaccharide/colanic/teichoic acid biosynthesis glycosyltransferase
MDAVALKRLRTVWELVFSYAFLVSASLFLRNPRLETRSPELFLSVLILLAVLFVVSYLWGSYDLEIGPAYGIRLRTEAVFVSTGLTYLLAAKLVFPWLTRFPVGYWISLFLYLNLASPLLALIAGKLARVPALCVFEPLHEYEERTLELWGYRCAAVAAPEKTEEWLRSHCDERNRPDGCEAVLFDMRESDRKRAILSLSRLYFVDFVGVRATDLGSYLLGRHCSYITFMPMGGLNHRVKRIVDLVLSMVLLAVLSPLILTTVIAIKLDSPGPVFYKHRRLGKSMRYFWLLKFRTMYKDADTRLARILQEDPALKQEFETTYKLKNDPRATRVGRILRRTSFDEIPQLFNIIRDQMSLVGPRPIVAGEIPFYKKCQMLPFRVTPGATGLWQISGRTETSYERRVELDVQYVTNWSYWRDLRIILATIPAVLSRRGAY